MLVLESDLACEVLLIELMASEEEISAVASSLVKFSIWWEMSGLLLQKGCVSRTQLFKFHPSQIKQTTPKQTRSCRHLLTLLCNVECVVKQWSSYWLHFYIRGCTCVPGKHAAHPCARDSRALSSLLACSLLSLQLLKSIMFSIL